MPLTAPLTDLGHGPTFVVSWIPPAADRIFVQRRTSLSQRLRAHAKNKWPQLTAVHVRYHGQFAYVAGELAGGDRLPLMRLRYGGSAHRWGSAIYVASKDTYEDQIWFTGTVEDTFDLVCDLHVTNTGS